jgi:hypothetical protein
MTLFKRSNLLSLLALIASVVVLDANALAQESTASLRQRFTIFPALRPCDPARVKAFSLGKQPLDAILAEVMVENNSDKIISAVKLRWRVYGEKEGREMSFASCPPKSASVGVLLTGTSDVIELTSLSPQETATIGINPLPTPTLAVKTVFVGRPLVSVEDVKSVATDRNSPTSVGRYALVIFVSEIRYNDGTTWTAQTP